MASAAQSASAATAVPTCTGGDLTATIDLAGGGALGTRYGDIKLTDRTSHRCELSYRPHSMYFFANGTATKVGAWADYAYTPVYSAGGHQVERTHFDLSAGGGHAYIRIGISDYNDTTRGCDPVKVSGITTHVQGSRTGIIASLPGSKSLTICSSTRVRQLYFSEYITHRSTSSA